MSGDPTNPVTPPEPVPEPVTPPPPAPVPPAPAPAAEVTDPVALSALIGDLRRELDQARSGASAAADQARDAVVQEIGRALGLVADENSDPEQVIAELTARASTSDQQLRDYRIKDAITTAADTHHGDPKLLLPYLRGTGALDGLDLEAADFGTRLDAVVAKAITDNPKLADTPPVPRSGGEFGAGNATPPPAAEEHDIEALRRKVRDSINGSRT
ncbi:hypothetical protein [Nocardia sp. NPDC005366]|uniref:hypothetical protein n=1 Tax=Nocardia sp. NPDC005366 TaxID=3156878 RepID=UPI0033B7C5AF